MMSSKNMVEENHEVGTVDKKKKVKQYNNKKRLVNE